MMNDTVQVASAAKKGAKVSAGKKAASAGKKLSSKKTALGSKKPAPKSNKPGGKKAGLEPSPCFYNFLARTTFVLESLLEAKNPGQDAFFGGFCL